ncbi:hypothetical protein Ahu01nite_079980 [Winogradskya humida]|uniref:Uncharacterized protein n=1 Tax=Winogradskya humida TaxID=113566 RepID=A0ABQ4A233_9ACTN|nr:hypothetical protein Ahu01nite_079980 [Actinoplanes humidus]
MPTGRGRPARTWPALITHRIYRSRCAGMRRGLSYASGARRPTSRCVVPAGGALYEWSVASDVGSNTTAELPLTLTLSQTSARVEDKVHIYLTTATTPSSSS